jgi:hypothetical protein
MTRKLIVRRKRAWPLLCTTTRRTGQSLKPLRRWRSTSGSPVEYKLRETLGIDCDALSELTRAACAVAVDRGYKERVENLTMGAGCTGPKVKERQAKPVTVVEVGVREGEG